MIEQWDKGWKCPACGLKREEEHGPDPCWGMLPGVDAACCGHGGAGDCKPYILFENGMAVYFAGRGVDGISPALGPQETHIVIPKAKRAVPA